MSVCYDVNVGLHVYIYKQAQHVQLKMFYVSCIYKTADYVLLQFLIFAETYELFKTGEALINFDFACDR